IRRRAYPTAVFDRSPVRGGFPPAAPRASERVRLRIVGKLHPRTSSRHRLREGATKLRGRRSSRGGNGGGGGRGGSREAERTSGGGRRSGRRTERPPPARAIAAFGGRASRRRSERVAAPFGQRGGSSDNRRRIENDRGRGRGALPGGEAGGKGVRCDRFIAAAAPSERGARRRDRLDKSRACADCASGWSRSHGVAVVSRARSRFPARKLSRPETGFRGRSSLPSRAAGSSGARRALPFVLPFGRGPSRTVFPELFSPRFLRLPPFPPAHTMGSGGGSFAESVERGCDVGVGDGLIPRFVSEAFSRLFARKEEGERRATIRTGGGGDDDDKGGDGDAAGQSATLTKFEMSASFLEVYGEDVFDLLDDDGSGDRQRLRIREDSSGEVIVAGLKRVDVSNAYEAMGVLNSGISNRTTASTLMNDTSSRSHAVFAVDLIQTARAGGKDDDESTTRSRFTFVDLAGSERMKRTGAEGRRAKEGIRINEGLLALGNVINALGDEERLARGEKVAHVPYRQSKLTRLLQDALGGNSRTLFLACASPSDSNAAETLSTLRYAHRARNIRNVPQRGVDARAEEVRRLRALATLLRRELVRCWFARDEGARRGKAAVADPEVERERDAEGSNAPPPEEEVGTVDEELLRRDDVVAYLKRIDERAAEVSGSSQGSGASAAAPLAARAAPSSAPAALTPRSHLGPSERSAATSAENPPEDDRDAAADDDGDDDDSANPEEDLRLIDDLLDNRRREDEQIAKMDGDIAEQEGRLLQLREHVRVYADVKGRHDALADEVRRLEDEKRSLAEKLERALADPSSSAEGSGSGGCSLSIKSRLDQVKASLARARQDVRRQQQRCREAEMEAQRCKGLERRIEEMKGARAHLLKKQKEDARRQKDFSETKAREIQTLRKREKESRKRVSKLEAECQRHKAEVDRGRARHEKLAEKLRRTEASLKQAQQSTRKRSQSAPRPGSAGAVAGGSHDEEDRFAPPCARLASIKFVLDKVVSDRVALSRAREAHASKSAEREELVRRMAEEVHELNELKRECEAAGDGIPMDEVLAEVGEREDNVQ
ncbi:hypothetical protein ACHAWF_004009, partial [Thalassiosira exigua]